MRTLEDRFWEKVLIDDGCWLWVGGRDRRGYGKIGDRGKTLIASRLSYVLAHGGTLTREQCVCHACDVPACVRPGHLFLGTKKDNMQDASRKGRATHGERHASAKLTAADVERILQTQFSVKGTQSALARELGVADATVFMVRKRRRWKHV